MNLIKLMLIGLAVTTLSACSKTVKWEEEVPLNTGDVIWVKREVVYNYQGAGGNPFDFDYRPSRTEKLAFDWKGKEYAYVGDADLILLAIQPNSHLPVLVTPKGTGNWVRSRDIPCVKPYYVQLVVNESKWEWQVLQRVEPWLYNMPSNLMAKREDFTKMSAQARYTTSDRISMDTTMAIQSPDMARIDPNYQPEICTG